MKRTILNLNRFPMVRVIRRFTACLLGFHTPVNSEDDRYCDCCGKWGRGCEIGARYRDETGRIRWPVGKTIR